MYYGLREIKNRIYTGKIINEERGLIYIYR